MRSPTLRHLSGHFAGFYKLGDYLSNVNIRPLDSLNPMEREEVEPLLSKYWVGVPSEFLSGPAVQGKWAEEFESFIVEVLEWVASSHSSIVPRQLAGYNAVVHELYAGRWRFLDKAIGHDWTAFLISKCAVFKPLGRDCWQQVTGLSLQEVWSAAARMRFSSSRTKALSGLRAREYFRRESPFAKTLQITPFSLRAKSPAEKKSLAKVRDIAAKATLNSKRLGGVAPASPKQFTPQHIVARFLWGRLSKFLPHSLVGAGHNWNILLHAVEKLVHLRASEIMTVGTLGMRTSEVPWLSRGLNEFSKQRLLSSVLDWIFTGVVRQLIFFYFHVTDTSFDPSGTYFYPHYVWRKLRSQSLEEFSRNCSDIVPIVSQDTPILSQAVNSRVIPKNDGARVVVNLKTLKEKLSTAHYVLRSLSSNPSRLNVHFDCAPRLEQFRRHHLGQTMYLVKADISNCYDTANTQKLLQLLEKLIGGKTFIVQQNVAHKIQGRSMLAPSAVSIADFGNTAPRLGGRQNCVISELRAQIVMGNDIIGVIRSLLTTLQVRAGRNVVTKNKGIPQGSAVSLDLCDLLYDDLVRNELGGFVTDSNCLLMRYVDDFLFVTPDKELANQFLYRMKSGFPEYGAFVKPEKVDAFSPRVDYLGFSIESGSLQFTPIRSSMIRRRLSQPPRNLDGIRQRIIAELRTLADIEVAFRRARTRMPQALRLPLMRSMGALVGERLAIYDVRSMSKNHKLAVVVLKRYLRRNHCRALASYYKARGTFTEIAANE